MIALLSREFRKKKKNKKKGEENETPKQNRPE
jgi:hypothetical protein